MTLIDQRNNLEQGRRKLWKAFFTGRANKGTFKALDHSKEAIIKINQTLYPKNNKR